MYKVLVVDDEEFNIDLIESGFIEDKNVEIIKATTAMEALKKMNKSIDVVLLDIRMPGMSGIEVLKRIKGDKDFKYTPVIMVTANPEEKLHALEIGADDFLSKPIDMNEVRLKVLNYAKVKRAYDRLEDLVAERTRELKEALDVAKKALYAMKKKDQLMRK
jgi:putative two-component system response regulator